MSENTCLPEWTDKDGNPMSNTKVLSKYFGKKDGGTLAQFADEIKQLTEQDKQQLGDGIRNVTLTY